MTPIKWISLVFMEPSILHEIKLNKSWRVNLPNSVYLKIYFARKWSAGTYYEENLRNIWQYRSSHRRCSVKIGAFKYFWKKPFSERLFNKVAVWVKLFPGKIFFETISFPVRKFLSRFDMFFNCGWGLQQTISYVLSTKWYHWLLAFEK